MDFYSTSRRDDLVSLCYILIYLLHEGNLLDLDIYKEQSSSQAFKTTAKIKSQQTMKKLCYGKSECLKKFVFYVFSLGYEDKPDYKYLHLAL